VHTPLVLAAFQGTQAVRRTTDPTSTQFNTITRTTASTVQWSTSIWSEIHVEWPRHMPACVTASDSSTAAKWLRNNSFTAVTALETKYHGDVLSSICQILTPVMNTVFHTTGNHWHCVDAQRNTRTIISRELMNGGHCQSTVQHRANHSTALSSHCQSMCTLGHWTQTDRHTVWTGHETHLFNCKHSHWV